MPLTSVVNFTPGEDVANAVDIGLGAGGTVLVQPFATTHLVVDIYGYFTGGELAGSNTALGDSALPQQHHGHQQHLPWGPAPSAPTPRAATTPPRGPAPSASNTTGIDNTATGLTPSRNNTGATTPPSG